MAVIKINTFGGITPSVDPRNLPPGGAQTAHNLELRFGDFRPLRDVGAAVGAVTVPAGAKTIFQTPAGVWLSSADEVNYVNGQINDAAFERVYLTGRTAGFPEVWRNATYYRLGVPTPRAAPTVTVVEQDEFLAADREAAANRIIDTVVDQAVAASTATYLGDLPTAVGSGGAIWLAFGQAVGLPTATPADRAYAVPATGTSQTPVITLASDAYLTDPMLGGRMVTYAGNTYWAVGTPWRADSFSVNTTTLTASLQTILKPTTAVALFSGAQAAAIAQRIADLLSPTKDPVKALLAAVNQRQLDVISLLQRTDVNATRASALSVAASALQSAVSALNAYVTTLVTNLRAYIATILAGYVDLLPPPVARLVETRAYVFTFVNAWDEESAPSPPSDLVELDQNDWCSVTCPANTPTPDEATYVPLTKYRVYRSSTTTSTAEYQLVAEYLIATIGTAQTDTKLQEALEETCPTITWVVPPTNLKGLVGLPNGVMAGFFGKTICFSDPFHPYAWPVEYQHTVEYNVVGLGTFGQTLVVLTEANPYYFSGADAASMSGQKIESVQACVSARSVVSVEGGVIYASPDGICIASPTGIDLATAGAYDKFDWQALSPSTSFASFSEGVYYLFRTGVTTTIALDFVSKRISTLDVSVSNVLQLATAATQNPLADQLYIAVGTTIRPMFISGRRQGIWRSGRIGLNSYPGFAWLRLSGPFTSAVVRVYADGTLFYTTPSITSTDPVRLPAGRFRDYEFELQSDGRVTAMVLAHSSDELRQA